MSAPTHLLRQRLLQPWNSWRMEGARARWHPARSTDRFNPTTTADTLHHFLLKSGKQRYFEQRGSMNIWCSSPKKGDLGLGAKSFFSIPSKVFCCIVFERLRDAIDKQLRCKQEGFRKDKSCTDHIATLRIIVEQSNEWQLPFTWTLLISKRPNSDDRNVIWKLMYHYGIPSKFIKLIQDLYGAEEDVKSRLGKAGLVLNMVRPVWNASPISTKTKLRIVTANVKATLLYGSETWKVTQALSNKLQSLVTCNKCLREIFEIHWQERNTSKVLWSRTGQKNVPTEIARQK